MHFEDLDIIMRSYEEMYDLKVLPNIYMVARLDGKGFSKLTRNNRFKKPFDDNFSHCMVHTAQYLMKESGFSFLYGYTQSDEISLLFSLEENTFNRKLRKLNSVLAGLASAVFTKELNIISSFDCRISQLPSQELVQDYFSWRQADSIRNALNAYVFWHLVNNAGYSNNKATSFMHNLSNAKKKEYLLSQGVNFDGVANWHKNGKGMYFEIYSKEGFNPKLNINTLTFKKRLIIDKNLQVGKNYRVFIKELIK